MPGPKYSYDGEFVITNIDNMKNDYKISRLNKATASITVSDYTPATWNGKTITITDAKNQARTFMADSSINIFVAPSPLIDETSDPPTIKFGVKNAGTINDIVKALWVVMVNASNRTGYLYSGDPLWWTAAGDSLDIDFIYDTYAKIIGGPGAPATGFTIIQNTGGASGDTMVAGTAESSSLISASDFSGGDSKPPWVPLSRVIPGPITLRGRSSAYTPSIGGNPLNMGK